MNLSVGIVGLPNVGKSTLFNALLKKQVAFVANFPFATIEPNVGVVPVPDSRLEILADIIAGDSSASPQNDRLRDSDLARMTKRPPIVPATVKFVDIAGLVKGAAEGAGLGNKFLSHIREVSVICHVVRAFVDENIIREGSGDPENDYATVQTELVLADLQSLEKSKVKDQKSKAPFDSAQGRQVKSQNDVIEKIIEGLNTGQPVREMKFSEEEGAFVETLQLLTKKPEIILLNISEDEYSLVNISPLTERYADLFQVSREKFVIVCAKIESDLSELSIDEQKQYLKDLGFKESGLERLIKKAYETLGLISFLTAGEKEVHAWTIKKGANAVEAAGEIHTDFIKKFIKAEVVSYEDFVQNNGWKGSREKGKTRMEGRDYIMEDGNVVEFKIGS